MTSTNDKTMCAEVRVYPRFLRNLRRGLRGQVVPVHVLKKNQLTPVPWPNNCRISKVF